MRTYVGEWRIKSCLYQSHTNTKVYFTDGENSFEIIWPRAIKCHPKWYSVMQSDGKSFCGDVVLDSFNMVYSNEDSILDKKIEKRVIWDLFFWKNLILRVIP